MAYAPASAVLRTAASQIGVKEKGRNRVRYWADLKPEWQGFAWCATFVQWCLWKNGMSYAARFPYSCSSLEAKAKAEGRWVSKHGTPRPGDLVIYGTSSPAHVGIVERTRAGGYIQTIEGNTSNGGVGSQNNGDGVYRRIRSRSWVRGFIRIKYAPEPKNRPVAKYPGHQHYRGGRNDIHVGKIQRRLRALGLYKDSVDNDFGPKTQAAVKAFQKSKGLTRDGFVGPKTWAALKIPA